MEKSRYLSTATAFQGKGLPALPPNVKLDPTMLARCFEESRKKLEQQFKARHPAISPDYRKIRVD